MKSRKRRLNTSLPRAEKEPARTPHEPRFQLRAYWDYGPVAVLAGVWLAILFTYASQLAPFGDELEIILPSANYIAGQILTHVKYPSFPFYFYGFVFKITGNLYSLPGAIAAARAANYLLFAANLFLLHTFLRAFFPRIWALMGTLLFTTLPVVAFSAVYVKTEGLLIFQLLVTLLALHRMAAEPNAARWHVLAAVFSALSISTKLSPLPLLLYLANAVYVYRSGTPIRRRSWVFFAAFFTAALLSTWTNLWVFDKVLASWGRDIYFFPGAGPFNSVDGGILTSFPYGRFSSFFTVAMPLALGVTGIFFIGALISRSIPPWILFTFGAGNAVSLIIGLSLTRLRLPHGFTTHVIFFLVAGIAFLTWLAARPSGKHILFNSRLAWVLVAAALGQTLLQATGLTYFADGMSRVGREIRANYEGPYSEKYLLIQYASEFAARPKEPFPYQIKDYESLRERLDIFHPKKLYVFSSYVDNMCKYRNHPTYRDNCAYFFGELLAGKTDYRLERTDEIPWIGYLLLDPEFRYMAFYLFQRSSDTP